MMMIVFNSLCDNHNYNWRHFRFGFVYNFKRKADDSHGMFCLIFSEKY